MVGSAGDGEGEAAGAAEAAPGVASGAAPEIAVVIPHYDDVARLERCLAALFADPAAARAEIVVADNGTVPTPDLSRFPRVRLVVERERGAAAARNRGAAETRAPRLAFLDGDCVPERGWIEAALRALEGRDVVGGAIDLFDETPPPRSGAEVVETVFAFDQKTYVERKGFSVSANLLTWRRVFDDVGGFRGRLSEDVDWCRRARAKGCALVYDEAVRVRHPTRADMAALAKKFRRIDREMFGLQPPGPGRRLRRGLRALVMLLSPIAHAPRVLVDPRLSMRERLRGLAALVGLRARRAGWMARQALGLQI